MDQTNTFNQNTQKSIKGNYTDEKIIKKRKLDKNLEITQENINKPFYYDYIKSPPAWVNFNNEESTKK